VYPGKPLGELQTRAEDSPPDGVNEVWVNVLEKDGWLLVTVNDRKLGIIISTTETGLPYLKIAGYHSGETLLTGERRNVLAVKVEQIPKTLHSLMLPTIVEALPIELRELPLMFLL
jgi:hypothetical protein